jgi:8-oxo-dGTP pyrophosphatase MutT (NUDIX family)
MKILNNYVLGFAFSRYEDELNVLLIKKDHPEWQKDKYNGLGGGVEKNEQPIDAMIREFKEECGISSEASDWKLKGMMHGRFGIVHIFVSNSLPIYSYRKTTSEMPKVFRLRHNGSFKFNIDSLDTIWYDSIENLKWLVPMMLDDAYDFFEVAYHQSETGQPTAMIEQGLNERVMSIDPWREGFEEANGGSVTELEVTDYNPTDQQLQEDHMTQAERDVQMKKPDDDEHYAGRMGHDPTYG